MREPAPSRPTSLTGAVMTVLGPTQAEFLGVTDAHNHVWIEPVPGSAPDSPLLVEYAGILAELKDYRQAGGGAILDCQPGGCGRNAVRLAELSRVSGVTLLCATGFHRRRYYAPNHWLWQAAPEQAAAYFQKELSSGVAESEPLSQPIRAGFIKVACEASLKDTPLNALLGAAQAAAAEGAVIEVHTEKGSDAQAIFDFLTQQAVLPQQIVLCHMDKRPDFGLHRALAQAGVLLEYDTIYRPKYEPERNFWPLVEQMVSAGLETGVALATDIAEPALWAHLGGGPGLAGLLTIVRPRLAAAGLSPEVIRLLLGGNIARRLAFNFEIKKDTNR